MTTVPGTCARERRQWRADSRGGVRCAVVGRNGAVDTVSGGMVGAVGT